MKTRLASAEADAFLKAAHGLSTAQRLYPSGHGAVVRAKEALDRLLERMFREEAPVLIALADGYLVAGGIAFLDGNPQATEIGRRLGVKGIEGVVLAPEVRSGEVGRFLEWLRLDGDGDWEGLHLALTRINRDNDSWSKGERLHGQAVATFEAACRDVEEGRIPDTVRARECVAAFSELLDENPRILLGLVLLKDYDRYTYYHSVNVSLLALGLAKQLGLGRQDLEWVGIGSLFHDIGKTRTPVEVIRKPGRLSLTETSLVRWHPVYGRDILLQMDEMPDAAPRLAYEHHMRLDGGGYPGRSVGELLHPLTPLVTAADIYDAMTSHRPYSLPLPLPAAIQTMGTMRGTHLPPEVLDAFLSLMGPIPVGSVVRLTSGEVAIVTKVAPGGAVVEVLVSSGEDGRELPKDRQTSRAVGGADVVGWVASLTRRVDPYAAVSRAR